MRGVYCLVIDVPAATRLKVGSMGIRGFPAGIYVYVGSALSGIENRVSRHRRDVKKRRWHIDYLLEKGNVLSIIAIPTERKATECEVFSSLASCDGASVPVNGFGSSDCSCKSHLLCFGDSDPEWVAETITMRLSMLDSVYPRTSD